MFFLNSEEDKQQCISAMTPFVTRFAIFVGFVNTIKTVCLSIA